MAAKSTLFSDDSDVEDNIPSANGDEISINKNYANYYESFRRKEELQKLKDKQCELKSYDTDSGESSDESLDEELVKPTIQSLDFLANTLLALKDGRAKDQLMNGQQNGHSLLTTEGEENEKKKKKKMKEVVYTMDTHRRETNWNTADGEHLSEDEREPSFPEKRHGRGLSLQHCTVDDLLAKKESSSSKETQRDPQRGHSSSSQHSNDDATDRMKQALFKPNMTADQKWLANFFINKTQELLEGSDSEDEVRGSSRRPQPSGEDNMHGFVYEDEETRTMRETLASFRGDGPSLDQQRPKSYPAVLESTVRVKDDKRRQRRLKDAERKGAEKQRLRQQVQQLQAIKRKEIQDRLKKIQDISGQTRLAFSEQDLDDEFDPDAHDRKMQEAFGQDYYEEDGDGKKPVFEYDEGIDEDLGDYDGYQVHAGEEAEDDDGAEATSHDEGEPDEGDYPEEHDAEAPTAAEGAEAEAGISRRRRGKRRKNDQLAQALQRKKPLFNPEEHDFDKYFDEYYALNFEDVIAGGEVKCRFKYKQVEPNNFGLSTEEILVADDKELNRWCGLKKILKIDRTVQEEERDRKVYKAKGQNIAYKKKMLPTLFKPPEEEKVDTEIVIDAAAAQRAEEDKKKKKNLKKKLRKQRKLEEEDSKKEGEENLETPLREDDSDMEAVPSKAVESKSNKRKRDANEDDKGECTDDQEHDVDDELKTKKTVHSTTTVLKAKKSKADELHKFNKKMKRRRCEEEAKLEGEGLKQKSSQRKSRKDIVAGDAYSTVLKLSDERLAAYNITGLSKIKKQARYHDKMAERGQQAGHKTDKGDNEKRYNKKEKSRGHDKSKNRKEKHKQSS